MDENLTELLRKFTKKTNDLYALFSNVTLEQEANKSRHEDLKAELSKKSDEQSVSEKIDSILKEIKDIQGKIFNIYDYKDEFNSRINYLVDVLKSHEHLMSDSEKKHAEYANIFKEIKDSVLRYRHDLDLNMHQNVNKLKDEVMKKFDSIVFPKEGVSLEEMKAYFDSCVKELSNKTEETLETLKSHMFKHSILEKKINPILIKMRNNEIK